MEIFKLFGKIAVDNSEANRAIDETVGNVGNAEPRMTKALKKIGAAVVAAFAVDKIKDFGKACISAGMDFDSQMSTVAAISGATGEEFEILRAKAQEMGATTAFSATESAQAMEYMAMAGWKTTDITNGLAGVMNLAAASGEDLATTSDIVTDAMTAFGMSADQSTYFADVLAQTATNANTNVGMMGETFKYVAPLAGAMGYNIEDMSAAIGLMANAGIKGSQSGTSLRNIITNLASPTDTVAGAMDDLGISLTDSDGKTKSFGETLSDLRISFADLNEVQKTQYASAIAGKEGMSGLLALINSSDEDFDKLTDSIKNCTGASEKMAEIRLDNLEGDVTLFKSALEGAQIAISDKLTPVLRNLVKKATDAIPRIQKKITSIFDSLKKKFIDNKETLSKLKDGIKQFGNIAKDAFEKLFNAAGNALDILFDFLEWLTSGSAGAEAFKTSVMGIVTAYMTFKAVTTVIDLTKAAVDRLRNAQMKLNLSNPVGWISLAISAFITLETTLKRLASNPMDEIRKKFSTLSDEEKRTIDKTNELSDAYAALEESWKSNSERINAEYDSYESLAEQLDTMVDKNGRIKEGYEEQAEVIVGQLSEALGIEVEIVDGVIQKYDDLQDSIQKTIDLQKAQAWLDANKSNWIEACESQKEAADNLVLAENDLIKVNSDLFVAESWLKDVQDRRGKTYENIIASGKDYNDVLFDAQAKVDGLRERQGKLQDDYDNCNDALSKYNSTIKNYEGVSSAIIEGDTDKINQALERGMENFITAETGTKATLQQQVDDYKTEYENMKTAVERGSEHVSEEELAAAKRLYELSQEELEKKGDMEKAKAEENGDKYVSGIKSKEGAAKQAGEDVSKTTVDALGSADSYSAGEYIGDGLTEGMRSKLDAVREAASSLATEAARAIKLAADINSPSKVTRALGQFFGLGFSEGISDEESNTIKTTQQYADSAVNALKSGINNRTPMKPMDFAINTRFANAEAIQIPAVERTEHTTNSSSNTAILNKLNELIEVIKGQKVYLDSGALVGEIAPAMDGALGNISRMKRRGLR
ncbi:MAG: phage tail tape measure protein [Oscillospiraceae bacterium]